jgi:hypothetical protein
MSIFGDVSRRSPFLHFILPASTRLKIDQVSRGVRIARLLSSAELRLQRAEALSPHTLSRISSRVGLAFPAGSAFLLRDNSAAVSSCF